MATIRPQRSISDYADLLDLPPHEPTTRPRMSMNDRAAQFSPYAALVGYGDMVEETARLTDEQLILDDTQKESLNSKLTQISDALSHGQQPAVEIDVFVPDSRKAGGSYQMFIGRVKRIDAIAAKLILTDRKEIPIDRIREIYGELWTE